MTLAEIAKLKRYETWTEIYALADQLCHLAEAWWNVDEEIQAIHYERCDFDPFDDDATRSTRTP